MGDRFLGRLQGLGALMLVRVAGVRLVTRLFLGVGNDDSPAKHQSAVVRHKHLIILNHFNPAGN